MNNHLLGATTSDQLPGARIDLEYLYSSLLLFDKLVDQSPTLVPTFIRFSEPMTFYDTPKGHLHYLQEIGLYRSWRDRFVKPAREAVLDLRAYLAEQDEADWLVNPIFLKRTDNREIKYAAFRLELIQGLIIPDTREDIDNVLEFKSRRNSELIAFWNEIYSLTQDIDFDDKKARLILTKTKIDEAISNLSRVTSERWKNNVIRSTEFGVRFDSGTIANLLATTGAYLATGVDVIGVFGAAASFIRLKLDLTFPKEEPSQVAQAVSYLSQARTKLGVK